MIGNDIVDLAQARKESNWQRKGFLEKLFSAHEQHLIDTAADPERMVWLLWTMKESAYKAAFRTTRLRRFAPQKISCQLSQLLDIEASGTAFCEAAYQTKTTITPNYIASLAFPLTDSSSYQQTVIPLESNDYPYQSAQIRQKLLVHSASLLAVTEANLRLRQNDNGVPDLIIDQTFNKSIVIPVSLTHHGYYGAYVVGWPNESCCSTPSY